MSASLPAFPPMPSFQLPSLSFTYSDGASYKPRDNLPSKHAVVKTGVTSVIDAFKTLPDATLDIVIFNTVATRLENTAAFDAVYPNGGTSFKAICECVSTEKEEKESALFRSVKILLTDGFDSSKKDREELMASHAHVGLFDGIIGVGDVDVDFLKHLSSNAPSTFTQACDSATLLNAVKALCFGGATSIARDVSLVFLIENRNVYIPNDSSIKVETIDMIDTPDPSLANSNTFECEHCPENNMFMFSVKDQPDTGAVGEVVRTKVTLAIDNSHSMSEPVAKKRLQPIYVSSKNESGGYLKVTVDNLRSIDKVYRFLGKGNICMVFAEYTSQSGERRREIVNVKTVEEATPKTSTFKAGGEMLEIMRGLESSGDIKALYLSKLASHASVLQDPSIPEFMKKLFSFVWDRLRNAYKMNLSSYDKFLQRGEIGDSPCMMQLVHTLSACATDTSASSSSTVSAASSASTAASDEITKCSICFDAESTILCLPCKHIGTCEPCFKKNFEGCKDKDSAFACPPCPFCKTPVEEVRQITSIKCPCCESPATRVGVCRHPLACGKAACRVGDPSVPPPASATGSQDTLYCHTCKEHVGSFHVWHQ